MANHNILHHHPNNGAQEFIGAINGVFSRSRHRIERSPAARKHEELISLSSQRPLPGNTHLKQLYVIRPIPGFTHESKQLWPELHGHRIMGFETQYSAQTDFHIIGRIVCRRIWRLSNATIKDPLHHLSLPKDYVIPSSPDIYGQNAELQTDGFRKPRSEALSRETVSELVAWIRTALPEVQDGPDLLTKPA